MEVEECTYRSKMDIDLSNLLCFNDHSYVKFEIDSVDFW